MKGSERRRVRVLDARIDSVDWDGAITRINAWAGARESRVVCICNVHSVVTASQDARYAEVIEKSDLATPDGAPIAWMLRRLGARHQQRISGPDLMLRHCADAAKSGLPIFLYGGSQATLDLLKAVLPAKFPGLCIAGAYSPPYRELAREEDDAITDQINRSGAGVVWVGLGCPKQEMWMSSHRGRINAVMIGVGAAFDYHAGTVRRAPKWMQAMGLEWFFRLAMEPRRLWRRYVATNSRFILMAVRQLAARRK